MTRGRTRAAETAATERTYRGVPLVERQAERRRRLLDAALTVYSQRGYRHSTVRDVCESAGLTQRYFYESFEDSEALLLEAYRLVTFGLVEAITTAPGLQRADRRERGRAMLAAFFDALKSDPRSARVFLVEIRGVSPAVDDGVNRAMAGIASTTLRVMDVVEDEFTRLLALGIVGGITQVAQQWIREGCRTRTTAMTDVAMALSTHVLGPNPPRGRPRSRPRAAS